MQNEHAICMYVLAGYACSIHQSSLPIPRKDRFASLWTDRISQAWARLRSVATCTQTHHGIKDFGNKHWMCRSAFTTHSFLSPRTESHAQGFRASSNATLPMCATCENFRRWHSSTHNYLPRSSTLPYGANVVCIE